MSNDQARHVATLANRADALFKCGEVEKACEIYERAIKIEPHNATMLASYAKDLGRHANALAKNGDAKKSYPLFERALEVDPSNVFTLTNYGNALAKNGRAEESYPLFERALEVNSEDVITLTSYGNALADNGRAEESYPLFERALKIKPHDSITQTSYDRAKTLASRGEADSLEVYETGGLEEEKDDPSIRIERPFDPEKIKVRTSHIVVELLVSRIKHDEIDLEPDFQRSFVWNPERQSRLIESLLLRIPIPVFYVAADEEEKWSVVDGVQRMFTIYNYVTNGFRLSRLEYLNQLNELKYDDLPRPMQRRINETQLVVNVIEPGTSEDVMFNIFKRINTGGVMLNGQEIRNALHRGPVREYLRELARTEEFLDATVRSVKESRMADRECVLRFLAFHIEPWEHYEANDLDGYLGRTMRKINRMTQAQRDTIAEDFKKAMWAAASIFGEDAFRKRYKPDDSRRPVSKALFEAWSVQLARCSPEQINTLISRSEEVRQRFMVLMNQDSDFDRAISYATGIPQRVNKRFSAVKQLVQGMV